MARKILISGAFGFLGSNLVRMWSAENPHDKILVLDHLGPTSDTRNLLGMEEHIDHVCVDLRNGADVQRAVEFFQPDGVINCGTAFHFEDFPLVSRDFYDTDVLGTFNLLTACRDVWGAKNRRRFLQVSTDEVFGTLRDEEEPFCEADRPDPRNAYGMAKAASDQVVLAHYVSYGMDVVVTLGSNTYGPNQRSNFLIPYIVRCAMEGKPIRIPDATSIRDWIYVEDHCWGIMQSFEMGRPGAKYCLGGNAERSHGDVAELTCAIFERLIEKISAADFRLPIPALELRDDIAPDRRAITSAMASTEFGWEPDYPFDIALENTVMWYINRFLGHNGFH